MNKKVGNILKYGISALLAAALLYFAFRGVNWTDFWSALKACRWEYVILSMLFGLLAFLCRATRWRELILPFDSSTTLRTCFNAVNISYVVNMALPRVGEVLRCGYITRHSAKETDEEGEVRRKASFDKVLGTAALERSVDIVVLLGLLMFQEFLLLQRIKLRQDIQKVQIESGPRLFAVGCKRRHIDPGSHGGGTLAVLRKMAIDAFSVIGLFVNDSVVHVVFPL